MENEKHLNDENCLNNEIGQNDNSDPDNEKVYRFVNEYDYNEETIKETIGAWWNQRYKMNIVAQIICLGAILVLFFATMGPKWLLLGGLDVLAYLLFRFKKNNSIKIEMERMESVYKSKSFKAVVSVDEDIRIVTAYGVRTVEMDEVDAMFMSKNYIILMVMDHRTIALSKTGFKRGSEKEFIEYIKAIKKRKKKYL